MLRTVSARHTTLDYAILGLLSQEPRSGYALRKLFAATPMGHFSDSPGSIYPALARLRRRGLVTATVQNRRTLRPRQVFRPTAAGLRTLKVWLSAPVTREELIAAGSDLMLRFAFAEEVLGPAAALRFLQSLESVLAAYVEELERYYEEASPSMPLGGRLALRLGVESHRTHLRWAQEAIRELGRVGRRKEVV